MIKLIVFDFSGVLADRSFGDAYFEKEFAKFLKRHGAEGADADAAWESIPAMIHTGKMTMKEGRRIFLRRLGLPLKLLGEYKRIDENSWRCVRLSERSVVKTLEKLRSSGIRLAVLSDTLYGSSNLRKILRMLGIGKYMHGVYVSAEMGLKKPHRKTYTTVLGAFKAKPAETLYVAHDEDELVGARHLRIKTLSYRGDRNADYRINKFSDILKVVDRLNGGLVRRLT